jgi:urease subunit gamma/beta
MRLTQTEIDRVMLFSAAEMARRRRERGVKLSHPEAVALISDELMEMARSGASYEEVVDAGPTILGSDDVIDGVPVLVGSIRLECVFDDGPRLIVVHNAVSSAPRSQGSEGGAMLPGEVHLAASKITVNAGRPTTTLPVRNTSEHTVQVSSHYHFYETNRRLDFDRDAAYGRHIDLPAGRSVRFAPGEEREVSLVPYAGDQVARGFKGLGPPAGEGR